MIEKKGTCNHCGFEKRYCICNTDSKSHFDIEMQKLEAQQRALRDAENQKQSYFDENEYVRKLRAGSTLPYAIGKGEPIKSHFDRLSLHVQQSANKNVKTHIWNNGRGPWFTHQDKFGVGCFMCEDINLIWYMLQIIHHFATKYPDEVITT